MKFPLCLIALLFLNTCFATTYYLSSLNGQDSYTSTQAQNNNTPWKSLSKLNTVFNTFKPGDSVLFNRGDVFYGSLNITVSGTASKPIYVGAYGSGAKPVITGLTTLDSWTSKGNGLYEATLSPYPSNTLNLVLFNDTIQPIGRYPKRNLGQASYFNIDAHTGSSNITSNGISGIPNFVGGELVQRTMQWIFDRSNVLTQTSKTVVTKPHLSPDHPTVTYESMNNHGFFFQNHVNTLTTPGDWCYNKTNGKLTMYFGGNNPNDYVVKVPTIDNLVTITHQSNIIIEDVELNGANENLLDVDQLTYSKINNCHLKFAGINAIDVDRYMYFNTHHNEISNCLVANTVNNAMNLVETTFWNINNNQIINTGMVQGMGLSGDGQYVAIFKVGSNSVVEYNEIANTGYNGIWYTGDNTIVRFNHIHHYCMVKSDGGGIYSYGVTGKNRLVHRNIVHDGPGDIYGIGENLSNPYTGQVHGIYNDGNTTNVTISDNTSFNNAHSGLWFGSNGEITATGNTLYNNKVAQIKGIDNERLYTNINIKNNNLFAVDKGSLVLSFNVDKKSMIEIASDNNNLCRPVYEPSSINAAPGYSQIPFNWDMYHDGGTVEAEYSFFSVDKWIKLTNKDGNSKKTPDSINYQQGVRFEYNTTNQRKSIVLNGNYKDLNGNFYNSVTLEPFTSIILLKSLSNPKVSQTIDFQPVAAKTFGDSSFELKATATSGLPVIFSIISGPATLSGNTITINGAGSIVIEATQAGNSNYIAATPVNQTLLVLKANQSVNFGALTGKIFGNAPFSINGSASSGLPVGFKLVSGPATLQLNVVTLTGPGNVIIEASQAGNTNYNPGAAVLQSFNVANAVPIPLPSTCSATGNILREQWNNIFGIAVSDIPLLKTPNSTSQLLMLETNRTGDNMGARIRGFICPPFSGNYTFYLAGDDGVELWLSTDEKPGNKIKIAGYSGWTGFHEWNKYPGQVSPQINLQAGVKYYIEVLHKNGGGGDHVSVKWIMPNGVTEAPIPGNRLSPYVNTNDVKTNQTIQFDPLLTKIFGDASFILDASASSNLPVKFTVKDGPVSLTGNTLSITGTGKVTIEATQDGNTYFNPATPVNQSFNIEKADQSINFGALTSKIFGSAPFTLNATALSGLPVSFKIISGPATLSGNTVTITGIDKVIIEASQAGNNNYNSAIPVTQSFNVIQTNPVPLINTCSATGSIFREQWNNIFGIKVSDIPLQSPPTTSAQISSLETYNTGENMGARIRGYICPPLTGAYTFYLAGDDGVELYLSTDDKPENKTMIAGYNGWTGYHEWNKYPGQKSNKITLQAGGKYYVEVLHKNGGGGDHVSVKWTLPDGTSEAPIPGKNLSPFTNNNNNILNQVINFEPLEPKVFGDAPITIKATASSGLPVTFKVISGPASISGSTLTITGAGNITVDASQAGNNSFKPANSIKQSFTVVEANQSINFAAIPAKTFGDAPFTINPTASSGLPVSVRIVSGPATITGNLVTLTAAGNVIIEATQNGNVNYNAAIPIIQQVAVAIVKNTPPSTCTASGTILIEEWKNVFGNDVANIPLQRAPNVTRQIKMLETQNTGDWMGARMRGYICPPLTGDYTFYLAGDDGVELWLSTDDQPENKIKIAGYKGWTGYREWNKYPTQKSQKINLKVGNRYYVEVLHKNGGGGDNVSVKWDLPNGVTEVPIPGSRLSPFTPDTQLVNKVQTSNFKVLTGEPIKTKGVINVFPNPFRSATNIKIIPAESGFAVVTLTDLQGRPLKELFNGFIDAKETKLLSLQSSGLPNGMYMIYMVSKNKTVTQKITILK